MLSALDTARSLLDEFRPMTGMGADAADRLEVFLRSQLAPTPVDHWHSLGFTTVEARMLDRLYRKPGEYVSREALFDAMYYDSHDEPTANVFTVHLCKVRRKLAGTKYSIPTEKRYRVGLRGLIAT